MHKTVENNMKLLNVFCPKNLCYKPVGKITLTILSIKVCRILIFIVYERFSFAFTQNCIRQAHFFAWRFELLSI